MKKALIVGMIGAIALVVVAKKTNVFSYASTFASQVQQDARNEIPTKFEIERIRNEIANMDSDVTQMIRPVAEYRADIEMLRREIAKGTARVEEQKKNLLAVVNDLQANKHMVKVGNKMFKAESVRAQLNHDMEGVKRIEVDLKTKQKILDAKEASFKATQEQLAKVVSKKREYELRLAQLETEAETLRIAQIATTTKFDSSRATQIEEALKGLERRLLTETSAIELHNSQVINLQQAPTQAPADLDVIRNYLEGSEETVKAATK